MLMDPWSLVLFSISCISEPSVDGQATMTSVVIWMYLLSFNWMQTNTMPPQNSGWKPITRESVYNNFISRTHLEQNSVNAERLPDFKPQNYNTDFEDNSFTKVSREQNLNKLHKRKDNFNEHDNVRNNEDLTSNFNQPRTQRNMNSNQETIKPKCSRKAKAISADESNLNKNLIEKIFKTDTTPLLINKHVGKYEVSEKTEDILDKQESTTSVVSGYAYEPPNTNKLKDVPGKPVLTESLSKILLKYNINPNDDLSNYALSRANKNQIPRFNYVYLPVPLRIPFGYNNLNHVPVNSMLAVLLSNFGHYLPGMYGVSNNYRNLYGNLASNNIHNNKPFGLYKVFSDNDVST